MRQVATVVLRRFLRRSMRSLRGEEIKIMTEDANDENARRLAEAKTIVAKQARIYAKQLVKIAQELEAADGTVTDVLNDGLYDDLRAEGKVFAQAWRWLLAVSDI